jgi:uncharacterized membrane protein YfcA
MPVYLVQQWPALTAAWPLIAAASAGVLAGTVGGGRLLRAIQERWFRRVVGATILVLGLAMLLTLVT